MEASVTSQTIKQIICAVHGGPESRETAIRAISLALESGGRLTFFHVMDAEFLGYATVGTLRVAYHELEEMGKFVMLILCDRARARGVTQVDYILRTGNIRKQLHQLAIETGAEVMVMGRPTRSPTKNIFKPGEFDAFVADLEREGNLSVIRVSPALIQKKDLQSGLVF
jgi:nucleotide-binding universal stress UspA family protein